MPMQRPEWMVRTLARRPTRWEQAQWLLARVGVKDPWMRDFLVGLAVAGGSFVAGTWLAALLHCLGFGPWL